MMKPQAEKTQIEYFLHLHISGEDTDIIFSPPTYKQGQNH